jgi:hypothetical protein
MSGYCDDCGNTLCICDMETKNSYPYRMKIKLLEQRLKDAEEALEDFSLRENHADSCRIRFQYGGGCDCMDRNYYSLESCAKRARLYFEKYKKDKG